MRAQRLVITLFVAVAVLAGGGGAAARATGATALGTLEVQANIPATYVFNPMFCEPGTPSGVDCIRFVGRADVPGLGNVTETYDKTAADPRYGCPDVTQARTAVLEVAGKGTIEITMGTRYCGPYAPAAVGPYEGTVSGGTGLYAGASGLLQFNSSVFYPPSLSPTRTGKASDRWRGTLMVPGHEFDVTGPSLVGIANKRVKAPRKAKRARVEFAVSASDTVDGSVPVACAPRSGSRFRIGRTKVTCSAKDASANKTSASFSVVVIRRR